LLWKGLSDMDVARALPGHGWPVSAGPWNSDGGREPDVVGPYAGASFLVPFQRLCTDRRHGGHMYGDMVDALWTALRVIQVNGSK